MNTLLIDIGGSWTRFRSSGTVERVQTPSHLRHPSRSTATLLREQISLVTNRTPRGSDVHIALGAAYDTDTDTAFGSAPLWGPHHLAIPFRRILERARPDSRWTVANDVSCALADFTRSHALPSDRYVMFLTVSSGIAVRTAHYPSRRIQLSPDGLQGEVGHLPATSTAPEQIRQLSCECGRVGHIAAISSGPAIPHVASLLQQAQRTQPRFTGARVYHSEIAISSGLLRVIVEPLANLLRTVLVLQPHVDLIGVGGGVSTGVGAEYGAELTRQLSSTDSYADNDVARRTRLHFVAEGEIRPEVGAQLLAHGYLENEK